MKNLIEQSKDILINKGEEVSLEEAFSRLPGNVINNELYVARKEMNAICDSLKNGDDFDTKRFSKLISELQGIKKEAKTFKTAEDVPQSFIYKS
jgi:hypothetical protein